MSILWCREGEQYVSDSSDFHSVFPYKVCINLERRPDRWRQAQRQFAEHNIGPVYRFSAVDGQGLQPPRTWMETPGAYGCLQSHLAVVKQAHASSQPSVVIFEDDVVLEVDFHAKFQRFMLQLPSDWDMLMLGGVHIVKPEKITENVYRVIAMTTTHAYALKHTIYDAFIALNSRCEQPVDQNNRILQQQFKCYCFIPHLAWQQDGFSDIREGDIGCWFVREALVWNQEEFDRIQRKSVLVFTNRYGHFDRSKTQLLHRLIALYQENLPSLTYAIITTNHKPGLDSLDLPGFCHYECIGSNHVIPISRAIEAGFYAFRYSKDYFIFSEYDFTMLWLTDFLVNVLMFEQYNAIGFYKQYIELSHTDTDTVLKGNMKNVDFSGYQWQPKTSFWRGMFGLTRDVMQTPEVWQSADLIATVVSPMPGVDPYNPPLKGLRLNQST
jgi:glycosyl transferase, family 25